MPKINGLEIKSQNIEKGIKPEKPMSITEEREMTGDVLNKLSADIQENSFFSSYKERYDHTPKENGEWTGERGESEFRSNNKEANAALEKEGQTSIEYKNAIPDFSAISKGTVEIDSMTDKREGLNGNFNQASEALALKRGCTPREVRDWMRENGYTWHECNDLKTCQKIPGIVNKTFSHCGGVGEYKAKINMESGDDFDE